MPRFNHMELTLPPGQLAAHRDEIREFFADVFGFDSIDIPIQDARVEIKEYEDLVTGPVTTHAFYVRFLLPIWFDVQVIEYAAGAEPKKGWRYAPV